ncbi:hypothetical protein APHCRT_0603 [Anaplasma phagocytophilum str. CRT53-1]|uniref:Uncharacterized protein n=1 Tax=Anaplasma phagocytophilum str. CRT53-1 TaxID=1359157 RepID=A0A0F3Q3R7_ANAPH|nr:hypothetical protein [Anaplasma phagocytophilum]KJV86089.1 hypothetical protein APHCRT_0603 [Anaplasma phagocytophilum str. CRT53-1]
MAFLIRSFSAASYFALRWFKARSIASIYSKGECVVFASDLGRGTTGENVHVDLCTRHVMELT